MQVKLYGGPESGKTATLRDDKTAFIRAEGGHYARVDGGLPDDFYWWDGVEVPWAVEMNGVLRPVVQYKDGKPNV